MNITCYTVVEFYRDDDNRGAESRITWQDEYFATREKAEDVAAARNAAYPHYDSYYKRDHFSVEEVTLTISDDIS